MRKRDIIRKIKEIEASINALSFAQKALEVHKYVLKEIIAEQTKLLSPKKEAKKEAKKTAVVSKKGGKPSKIERPAKKATKTTKKGK